MQNKKKAIAAGTTYGVGGFCMCGTPAGAQG